MKYKYLALSIMFFAVIFSAKASNIKLDFYADTYYVSDNDDNLKDIFGAAPHRKFASINNFKDRFALNIALFSIKVEDENYRATLNLQAGDIPDNVYFEKHSILQQANIGVRLTGALWLDAGYFSTPIGAEVTHPRYNYITSHSMVTYMEPTYHAGVKASYEFNKNFKAEAYIVNGNHLYFDNNENKSFMWNLAYANDKGDINLGYAGICGNEEVKGFKLHTLHDIFAIINLSDRLETKAQFDCAFKKDATLPDSSVNTAVYYGAFIQAKYKCADKIYTSARISYFNDLDDLYLTKAAGYDLSAAIRYEPTPNSYLRLETRYLKFTEGNKDIFSSNNKMKNSRLEVAMNFGLSFDYLIKTN